VGLVLDSSVLISAERDRRPFGDMLLSLENDHAETEFLLSSISVMELEHGGHRARPEAAPTRRRYLDEIFAVIPIEPFTREMAALAAGIDAGMKAQGKVIATADLLIGATALHFKYAVGTRNTRHFRMIPGLKVVEL
jgi:tRNA(fMet)-specific endonuclease VapC